MCKICILKRRLEELIKGTVKMVMLVFGKSNPKFKYLDWILNPNPYFYKQKIIEF